MTVPPAVLNADDIIIIWCKQFLAVLVSPRISFMLHNSQEGCGLFFFFAKQGIKKMQIGRKEKEYVLFSWDTFAKYVIWFCHVVSRPSNGIAIYHYSTLSGFQPCKKDYVLPCKFLAIPKQTNLLGNSRSSTKYKPVLPFFSARSLSHSQIWLTMQYCDLCCVMPDKSSSKWPK